ncbi:DUF547 domain-containing protein [Kordia sp.]|uniref:DUF547 domain-containing protein n=1 Tax=Kordia sp. TaxID=1965332 RepID=UPI003D26A8D7
MRQFIFTLFISTLCIACGTQQETVENTKKETTPINATIIDSVNAQHDKIAPSDSLNTTKPVKGDTDGYTTDNGETVTTEVVPYEKPTFNHDSWDKLLQKYVSSEGNVNYKGFKNDRTKLRAYIASLAENVPTNDWSKEEKLAYWINAYNALTVDLILQNYPLKSIKDIRNPWKQELWTLGGKKYDLETIEHKILRKMDEPRIHFAINCASFSCPPLLNKAFTASTMEPQLMKVTKDFLADAKRNTITKDNLEVSKIFKWFSKDFKQNGSLIDFLNTYSTVKISNDAAIDYKDYDWTLNE